MLLYYITYFSPKKVEEKIGCLTDGCHVYVDLSDILFYIEPKVIYIQRNRKSFKFYVLTFDRNIISSFLQWYFHVTKVFYTSCLYKMNEIKLT